MRIARMPAFAIVGALLFSIQLSVPASASTPLVIGIDYADPANQQPQAGRVFEYTDFFSREVSVHSGDTINFRVAPGAFHVVALASNEGLARQVYPVTLADNDGSGATDIAAGSGTNKLVFGPSNFPITGGCDNGQCNPTISFNNGFGPPVCGVAALGQGPCTFSGGHDIEVIGPNVGVNFSTGQPAFVDQLVQINAPAGSYDFFCYIHPGMRGKLKVVGASQPASSQAQIDARSWSQFVSDRAQGLAAERRTNHVEFTGEEPGSRTYTVHVGIGAAHNHVAIDEMFPNRPLNLASGDSVRYLWRDPHNFHSVAFPTGDPNLPPPFGFDCGATYNGIPTTPGPPPVCLEPGDTQFEVIGDPGNAGPGTVLSDPSVVVDAGVLGGTGYGVTPSAQSWWLATADTTKPGTYHFQCTIHDWMQGSLTLTAEE
jgi:plastocyanin